MNANDWVEMVGVGGQRGELLLFMPISRWSIREILFFYMASKKVTFFYISMFGLTFWIFRKSLNLRLKKVRLSKNIDQKYRTSWISHFFYFLRSTLSSGWSFWTFFVIFGNKRKNKNTIPGFRFALSSRDIQNRIWTRT